MRPADRPGRSKTRPVAVPIKNRFREKIVKLHFIAASLLAIVGASANVYADETRTEGLNLELTPYFWAAGIDGQVSARGQEVNFDRDFSDLIENVDTAFMMLGVLSYNRFVLYADYDYLNLTDDAKTRRGIVFPLGTKVNGEVDLTVGTYGAGYRFDTFGKNTIDVLVGAQLTDVETKLRVAGVHLDEKNNLTDTVIMLRPSFQISERWRFNPTLAYGVSGDSDTTYSMMPQFQYQFSDSFAARFGYKKLHYEFDEGGPNSEIDLSGLFVGIGWTFPARPEKVAAAPPPPPAAKPAPVAVAAAPAKCPDADRDGVCDAADQCPNTPAGTRVGPAGCDCDYVLRTHFAFDSAVLTTEDKTALDQLATVLKNPKLNFVTGEVDGFTDNVGKPEYNLALSKRRAQAVADYLKSKGVAFGDRFMVQGFGETKPIADNKTEEGRAQNRRASIHRTDCGPAN
jgi:outer membrane protein OmpA-like peptidoglycan-associated protein